MGRAKADDENVELEFDLATAYYHHRKGGAVSEFWTMARRLVDQGKPSQALQALVVMAARMQGGDEAVFHFLNRLQWGGLVSIPAQGRALCLLVWVVSMCSKPK